MSTLLNRKWIFWLPGVLFLSMLNLSTQRDVFSAQQNGISIQIPATATPGETITVKVEPPSGIDLAILWVANSLGNTLERSNLPPFEYDYLYTVPHEAIGEVTFSVLAVDRDGTYYEDNKILHVTSTARLEALEFLDDFPYAVISFLSGEQQVTVMGRFSDGITRDVSSPKMGTNYTPADPNVVQITPEGYLKAVGEGTTEVTISNNGHSLTLNAEVDFVDPNPGERMGGGQGSRDLFLTYSGPIKFSDQSIPMPPKGPINLPVNTNKISFKFHNNSALPQTGAVRTIVEGSLGGGSNANCAVSLSNNVEPPRYPPFGVVDGELTLSLPPGGGKCVFLFKIASAGVRDTDRIVVHNPSP